MRKAVGFVSKQGHLHPCFYSKSTSPIGLLRYVFVTTRNRSFRFARLVHELQSLETVFILDRKAQIAPKQCYLTFIFIANVISDAMPIVLFETDYRGNVLKLATLVACWDGNIMWSQIGRVYSSFTGSVITGFGLSGWSCLILNACRIV